MKIIWSTLLKSNFFRRALITHLKARYFNEFNHSIPLGNGYWADIMENDGYDSFSEIFIKQEYLNLLPNKKISRIVDIGAHYGYFSLWLQAKFPESEIYSLLIEPSPSSCRSLEHLVQLKSLKGRFRFINKAIGNPENKHSNFYDRPHMAGSIFASTTKSEDVTKVEQLCDTELLSEYPPPYDLIKCDIEGAEWDFMQNYDSIIRKTNYLLLEWHSWHSGGNGLSQLENKLKELSFKITKKTNSENASGRDGQVGLILAENQKFQF